MIHACRLTKQYRMGKVTVDALKGVDLQVSKGEFVCVAGPSGSGKTTLLNLVGCLDTPTSGRVEVDGADLGRLSVFQRAKFRREHLGFIFQNFNLLPVLNVAENIEFPLMIRGRVNAEDRARVRELIDIVGLGPYVRHRPDELSGGQRQRVAIARALVTQPRLVVADEPTASLDSHTSQQIMGLMLKLNRESGVTFLFSTHDESVMELASRIVTIRDGVVARDALRAKEVGS